MFGFVFNPLSVYWCHDAAGAPVCVVAEVHNTYGQRHCYLLRPDGEGTAEADKTFYVSPFFGVEGRYRMRLPPPGEELRLAVQLRTGDGRPFTATVRGGGARHRRRPPRVRGAQAVVDRRRVGRDPPPRHPPVAARPARTAPPEAGPPSPACGRPTARTH